VVKYYITIGRVQDGPVSFIGVRKQNPQAGFGPELHTTLELPSQEEKSPLPTDCMFWILVFGQEMFLQDRPFAPKRA
jgi:hypothetical protein